MPADQNSKIPENKKVQDSQIEQVHSLMSRHLNGNGRLFGGQLVGWIDEVAGIVARRHAQTSVVTAAIDNLIFKSGAKINDIIVLIGRVTYVGKTSMEVRVDTYVESDDGYRKMINRAYLVMVSLDEEGCPRQVPGLIVEAEEEKAEWDAAVRRSELRSIRRKEGF